MYRYVLSRAFLSHVIAEALNFENELRGMAGSFCIAILLPSCNGTGPFVAESFVTAILSPSLELGILDCSTVTLAWTWVSLDCNPVIS